MHTEGEVVDIPPSDLRHLIVTDSELSELLMRAFILRRVGLINFHMGDAVLVGSRNNAGTLRLMEFLTRNAHPYAYLDVEQDIDAQSFLDQFHVRVEDVQPSSAGERRSSRTPPTPRWPIASASTSPSTPRR